MILLPHAVQPITSEPASFEMRAWMERITDILDPKYVSVAGDVTTSGNSILHVTATCTITLNPTPGDGERVIVYHDGTSTFNVNITDGTGIDIIYLPGTVISYRYSTFLSKWVRGL